MQTDNPIRLFVGIPIPSSVSQFLLETEKPLRSQAERARWTDAESMHITLFFIGEAPTSQRPPIVEALKGIDAPSMELTIQGYGAFERAGILYAAVDPIPQLICLAKSVKEAMESCGFRSKEAHYTPHITLARSKTAAKHFLLKAQQLPKPQTRFTADHFSLYQSHLEQRGPRYVVLDEFALMGNEK